MNRDPQSETLGASRAPARRRVTLFALVDGHVSFATKGALNKHTVNVTPA